MRRHLRLVHMRSQHSEITRETTSLKGSFMRPAAYEFFRPVGEGTEKSETSEIVIVNLVAF